MTAHFRLRSIHLLALALSAPLFAAACGAAPQTPAQPMSSAQPASSAQPSAPAQPPLTGEEKAIAGVLDDWHAAAAKADEERYFGHLTEDAVFMGTDATERWDKKAFRAYAAPHFAKGKAWSFHAVRRAIVIGPGGSIAWFDEDLATERLGPARGSGVLIKDKDGWRIAHYNLSIPIPNERFGAVKKVIAGE